MSHTRRKPNCDCAACCDGCGHESFCMSQQRRPAPESDSESTVRQEVEWEDGYTPRRWDIDLGSAKGIRPLDIGQKD